MCPPPPTAGYSTMSARLQSWVIQHWPDRGEKPMDANGTVTLKERLAGRVARFTDRREDWSVFGFETGLDPRYARAQRRYLGASGSVDPSDLRGAIPAAAFTMSIQSMPADSGRPSHVICSRSRNRSWCTISPIRA